MALNFYYKDTLEKVTMQKKHSNFRLLFVTERTQLNATHAQLLEKLRPIALAETSRFLTIQSLEFQKLWEKDSTETTWMIYHEKSEFWHRKFLIIQKTINGELRKSLLLEHCWQKGFNVNS